MRDSDDTRRETKQALQERINFENLVADISTKFINLAAHEIDDGINEALQTIGQFAEVDRSYVFLFSAEGTRMSNTHEWCAEGIGPALPGLQNLEVKKFPWFAESIRQHETVHVPQVKDLPPEAVAEKREWQAEAIRSLICVPMLYEGKLIGFVGFDSVRSEKSWSDEQIALLRIVSEMLANAYQRKQVTERLTLLSSAVEQCTEGVAVSDVEGNLLFVNDAFARMHGYAPEEILNHPLSIFHTAEQLPFVEEANRQIREEGAFAGEVWHVHRDGHVFPTLMRNTLVRDEANQPIAMLGTARDITEQKQTEDALRKSEERFRTLFENSPIGSYRTTRDGRILDANPALVKMLGYSSFEELADRNLAEEGFEPLYNRAEFVERIEREGSISGMEVSWKTRDGSIVFIRENAIAIRDTDGHTRYYEGSVEDISERKRAEGALRQSERRFRDIAENALGWIWEVDADGRYTYASPVVREILGYEPEEVIGKHFYDFFDPQDREDTKKAAFEVFATKKPFREYQNRNIHKNGQVVWLSTSGVPMVDESGNFVGYRGADIDITERKRAEEASRESEARYRNLFDRVPVGLYRSTPTGQILAANLALVRMLGYPDGDTLLKRNVHSLYTESRDRERLLQEIDRNGVALDLEYQLRRYDGTPIWIKENARTIRDSAGNVLYYEGSLEDITERKQAEAELRRAHDELEQRVEERTADLTAANEQLLREITVRKSMEGALRESEEHLRTIVSASKDAIVAASENGQVTLFNPAAELMFGRSAEATVGQPLDCLMPEKYRERHQEYIEGYFTRGEPHEAIGRTIELPAVRRDGHQFPIELSLSIGQREGQRFALAVIRDITERKRTEEALVTRLRYEEGLAACSQALLADTEANETLTETLKQLREASNASRVYIFENIEDETDGLYMRQAHEACAPEVTPEIDNQLLQHLPYKTSFSRWQETLSRGEPIWGIVEDFPESEREILEPQDIVAILVIPVISKAGWYGFIGFDDTQTRRAWTAEDIRLLRTAAEMIGAFIERRQAQADLQLAKEAAEAANRAKSKFLANMSHEIRTPITAMLGSAELLPQATVEGQGQRTDMILRNGRHLLSLIDDLLDVSRLEAGKFEIRPVKCSLPEILADVYAATATQQWPAGVDFKLFCETVVPTHIQTDPTRFKQAVINLVNNALKFTESGHVWVRVAVDRDRPEPVVSVAVEDTGVGIALEDQERIFETFTQLERAKAIAPQGVGLGLPLVKWIAEQLGGDLELESTEGQGTTFTLTVQAGSLGDVDWLTAEEGSAFGDGTGRDESSGVGVRLRGRVLLAEDSSDARELVQFALQRAGVEVTAVPDGKAALQAAQGQVFDLILMDIRMPGMDGLEVTAELRRRGCLSPIVALTAFSSKSDQESILAAGFDDYWQKPISLARLVSDAAAYLDAESNRDSSPGAATSPAGEGDPISAQMANVIAGFERRLPARLESLKQALKAKDHEAVRGILHQLTGTAGICGHAKISQEAGRLLELARAGKLASQPEELQTLERLIAGVAVSQVNDPEGH